MELWMGGVLLVCMAAFLALRWDGQRRPRPMAVWMESVFLDNPFRRAVFPPSLVTRAWMPPPGARLGELGAGTGMVTAVLARAVGPTGHVWAIDRQRGAVARARRRMAGWPGCTVAVADARHLPWPDGQLDGVVTVAMLGEVPEPDRLTVLAECRRVLKPGGRVVLGEYGPDPHYLTPGALASLVNQAGFQVVHQHQGWWQHALVAVAEGSKGP
jgi:ubiquinone/menaquinone biosynthesis C-methylase UbiE